MSAAGRGKLVYINDVTPEHAPWEALCLGGVDQPRLNSVGFNKETKDMKVG